MERRTFVGASVAAVCSAATAASADPKTTSTELYELRSYTLKPAKRNALDEYLSKAYMPALKRLGVGPVGVFAEAPENDLIRVFVLLVHKSAETVATLQAKFAEDEEYRKTAAAYLAAKADDPVYVRIESSLLSAIAGMPRLEKPDASKPRLLNLRVYESHNERSAAKKVEMFEKGELAIFKRVGLTPVFFASAVVGDLLLKGMDSRDAGLARHGERLLARDPMLWLFSTVEGVEPTNNHAERVQRRAVLWRKKSFGCQSQTGCRFVERILTVVQSLRLQSRNTLELLGRGIAAHRQGLHTPTLCPIGVNGYELFSYDQQRERLIEMSRHLPFQGGLLRYLDYHCNFLFDNDGSVTETVLTPGTAKARAANQCFPMHESEWGGRRIMNVRREKWGE